MPELPTGKSSFPIGETTVFKVAFMGAKAYVLQLSENVRRSNEQKKKMAKLPDSCGITKRQCPCELKKGLYSYVTCWRKDKTRIYIRKEEFTKQIRSILNRIKLPDCIVTELQKELKTSKATERKFCTEEVARLKTEQNKLKQKMDAL